MVTIVRLSAYASDDLAGRTDPWQLIAEAVSRWLVERSFAAADVVVLLPFSSLLPLARQAFASRRGWMPRIETTETLAASLGPPAAGSDGPTFDLTVDRFVAARLLRSQRQGEAWERRDSRGFEQAARSVVATAHALLRAAAAVPPVLREAHWATARQALVPASGPGGLERLLARLALEWAVLAPLPATDRLFALRPAAWVVVRAGGVEALAERLLTEAAGPGLVVDTDVDEAAPFAHIDPAAAPALAVCDGFEHEAQATAAQIVEHLRLGQVPVALIAQDRILVRRVRALLERDGVGVLDETGWRLSTTRAAALVMNLLRAARADAPSDALLDWLKALPDRDARFGAALTAFERRLRREGLAGAAAVARYFAAAEAESAAAGLWTALSAVRGELAGAGRQPLSVWLDALRRALVGCDTWLALEADDAGRQIVAVLRLTDPDARPGEWHEIGMTLSGFTDWVDGVLEHETFRPGSEPTSPVVVTPLARAMLRPFAAIVLPGADEKHLGVSPRSETLLGGAQAGALGVPDAASSRRDDVLAFAQLLRTPRLTLLRRRADGPEPLADSPLVARLSLALARRGSRLAPWRDPRIEQRFAPTPIHATAPRSAAALLPLRLSATSCTALRTCPYRFFALNMLQLGEEAELDGEIEKRDYGNWLHKVLHAFHLDRDTPADITTESRRLRAVAEASRQAIGLAEADFLPFLAAFDSLVPRYLAWLHARDAAGWRWVAGETEVAVALDGFGGVVLRGFVDRIDHSRSGEVELIDYKTGSLQSLKDKVKEPLEDTQLAFYAALVDDGRPLEATYLAIGETRGAVESVSHPRPAESGMALREGLAADLQRIRAGVGLAALGAGKACAHCAARGICRRDQWSQVGGAPG